MTARRALGWSDTAGDVGVLVSHSKTEPAGDRMDFQY